MDRRAEFQAEHPGVHILSADQAGRVDLVMGALGWLGDEEQVATCTPLPGESSTLMRVELRELRGGWRTAVLKQALPWLHRDESVAMPDDRASAELQFYRRVAGLPEAGAYMPRLLGGDETRSVLLLEDFRGACDLTSIYRGGSLGVVVADALGSFLRSLRAETRDGQDPAPSSVGMRALNHLLLFEAPFFSSSGEARSFGADGAGLDQAALEEIEPGLGAAAAALRADRAFREALDALGRRFLDGGTSLVHGAFHPGNWLLLPDGDVRIVDPQFGSWGDAEFDIGAGLAHLLLARQPDEVVRAFLSAAAAPAVDGEGPDGDGDAGSRMAARKAQSAPHANQAAHPSSVSSEVRMELVARHAGAELIRRLIGGGQLPLAVDAGFRHALLEAARTAVTDGRMEVLET